MCIALSIVQWCVYGNGKDFSIGIELSIFQWCVYGNGKGDSIRSALREERSVPVPLSAVQCLKLVDPRIKAVLLDLPRER